MNPLDSRPDRDSVRVWLGSAGADLDDDQTARFLRVWDDCSGDDVDNTERLSAAVQYLLGKAGPQDAAERLQSARANLAEATDYARQIAVLAHEDGMSEVELARALGVDRARTLRRWLGKAGDARGAKC